EDLENENPPAQWTAFREWIKAADALLFVTPEYNRSVPAVLKNAIDVGSRPYGKNVWDGKPGAVVSVTPGLQGAFGANHHLRQSLVAVNILTLAKPEAYISNVTTLIEKDGSSITESTREFLAQFVAAFEQWIITVKSQ
ncbi:MAG: NAD(P)H-dependent oxidoreductase, partial [Candidatus Zixiibacteriota bacterium]